MGRQLAPDEPMFAGGVQDARVDLSLEGGDNLVDLDLLSAPDGDEGLDLDLGQTAVVADSNDVTGENTSIEFNLDEGSMSRTATQEIVRRDGPGTVEMPTLELPSSETPTVETPAVKLKNRGNAQPVVPTDATAEMAIDDLGLDLDIGDLPDADDATALAPGFDDVTRVARRDDSTQLMSRADDDDDDGTALLPVAGTGSTSMLPKLELDEIDLDVGGAMEDGDHAPTERDRLGTEQMPQLSELEPVTMSEVGTKLDLARAYMDMGDPDGARNILQEVLAEGSASQKQEARRLIDSLPGA
jgi:pilus assembly protein FimV